MSELPDHSDGGPEQDRANERLDIGMLENPFFYCLQQSGQEHNGKT